MDFNKLKDTTWVPQPLSLHTASDMLPSRQFTIVSMTTVGYGTARVYNTGAKIFTNVSMHGPSAPVPSSVSCRSCLQ